MKRLLIILLFSYLFSSCEKDDICIDDSTPRLVIEFFNINNILQNKNVTSLKVKATGAAEGQDLSPFSNVSKIQLPLKINDDTVTYSLTLNSNNTAFSNEDTLKINYTRNEVYVSRACGFKTIFELPLVDPFVHTDPIAENQKWIRLIQVAKNNIITENETHIKIYF